MSKSATFISYCRVDKDFTLRLARDLRAAGANVWLDIIELIPGKPWDDAIEKAVQDAEQLVIVLSPSSVTSENVRNEIAYAQDQGKRVIPVLYRDCKVPLRLNRLERIDFRTDYANGLEYLLQHLGATDSQNAASQEGKDFDFIPHAAWQDNELDGRRLERLAEEEQLDPSRRAHDEEHQDHEKAERKTREEAKEREARVKAEQQAAWKAEAEDLRRIRNRAIAEKAAREAAERHERERKEAARQAQELTERHAREQEEALKARALAEQQAARKARELADQQARARESAQRVLEEVERAKAEGLRKQAERQEQMRVEDEERQAELRRLEDRRKARLRLIGYGLVGLLSVICALICLSGTPSSLQDAIFWGMIVLSVFCFAKCIDPFWRLIGEP